MVFDEDNTINPDSTNIDDEVFYEDFWTEIKPYLIGLRDSITSIIEIID